MSTSYSWFWRYISRYAPLYRHVLVASVVVNLLGLSMPLFVMNVYDRIVPNNAFESLWVLAIGMVIAASLDFFLRIARMRFVDLAGRNADVKLQSLFLKRLMGVRLDALYKNQDTRSAGAILARMRELEYVREFLGSGTLLALTDLPFVLLFIALIFYLGGGVAIIPLLAIPCLVGFSLILQKASAQNSINVMRTNAIKQSFLTEIVASLETIRATRMERVLLQQWEKHVGVAADAHIHARMYTSKSTFGVVLFNMILTVLLVIVGVYQISEGLMSTGGLIACVILFGRCAGPMNGLVTIFTNYHKTILSVKQLDALMQLPTENFLSPDAEDTTDISTLLTTEAQPVTMTFEKVGFSYPSLQTQNLAVHNISMRIGPGAKLGIVGASGSGKSTLARLLAGIYVPTEGRVLLGTMDMSHTPMRSYRAKVGFLPQEIRIFSGTLRHNIAMAWPYDEPCDEEAILKAATLAGVMDFAGEHPLGLDMPLGEQGTGLSGGQAQSIALARALLGDPHTLILDEPTAQLDPAAERRLVQRLAPYLEQKTVFIFTHKTPMLQLVQRVLAMEKGQIIWEGSQQDAIAQKKL